MIEETPDSAENRLHKNFLGLLSRIRHTSTVRFYASKRLMVDYRVAQLTVVILSLWAILVSYCVATDIVSKLSLDETLLTAVGVILPVFIVVFSLLENGETFLRSYQLEANARQLRELSDQLYTAAAVKGLRYEQLLTVYDEYSQKYSNCLERTQANHDDVDHLRRIYQTDFKSKELNLNAKWRIVILYCYNVFLIQSKRALYVAFWFAPISIFLIK